MSIGRLFSNICGLGSFQGVPQWADHDAVTQMQNKRKAKVYHGIRHIAILTDQRYGQELHVVDQLNQFVRHARIGKITLKAAA